MSTLQVCPVGRLKHAAIGPDPRAHVLLAVANPFKMDCINNLTSWVKGIMEQASCQIRKYLIAVFEERQRANPRYSLRAYSRDLNIASSLLSRILRGRVPITLKMLLRIEPKISASAELMDQFKREIEESERRRKESRQAALPQLPNRQRAKNADATFVIPCRLSLLPEVIREIQEFKASLTDFVSQGGDHQDPVCELHISFRSSAKKLIG